MTLEDFITKSPNVTSKQEATDLIAALISTTASPTFGFQDYEYQDSNYPIDPYDHLDDDDDNDDSNDDPDDDDGDDEDNESEMSTRCKKIVSDYEKSLKLADILAKKWEIPFDPELTAKLLVNMKGDGGGLWNSSSIGC